MSEQEAPASSPHRPWLGLWLALGALLCHSCIGTNVEYSYNLSQPLNFVMTNALYDALDEPGRALFAAAALHTAEALGAAAGWTGDRGRKDNSLPSENATVQLTLGNVDCTGDRAGYVRWRPNNVLQVCPTMLRERSYLHLLSLVMHEMGHVVGASHVSCDGESVMGPDLNCPGGKYERTLSDPNRLFWYSERDVEELCSHTQGGICRQ